MIIVITELQDNVMIIVITLQGDSATVMIIVITELQE